MANIEESSDPLAPDIRPSSRISKHTTLDDHSINEKDAAHVLPTSNHGSDTRTVSATITRLVKSLSVVAFVAALLYAITTLFANTTRGTYSRTRPTPIFNLLRTIATWFLSKLSNSLGYELAESQHAHQHAKRRLDGAHIAEACMIPVCVALSGMFAGLTLGYFSVDPTQLQVLSISGTPKQQEYARRIMPVRKNSHLLLTTLILGNMIVNEALPVITDGVIGGGIVAVVVSTALVVIFAEIIPQSVCSRHGLAIGAKMAPVVRVLIILFLPLGWPIAKLLEYILGAHHGIIYRRSELRELIQMHAAAKGAGGDLDNDTITMAQGALDLAGKTAKDAMTPIDDVFMLPITAKLDYETLGEVVRSGHSRIPIYQMVDIPDIDLTKPTGAGLTKTKAVKKVIGTMLVKSCVLLDPEDATPLTSIPINSIPSVPWNEPLTNMLNAFQEGRSHMAIVARRGKAVDPDVVDTQSVMTAAAGGLKHRLMKKVAEIGHKSGSDDDSSSDDVELAQKKKHFFRRKSISTTGSSDPAAGDSEHRTAASSPTDAEKVKATTMADRKKLNIANAAKLSQNEQLVPADAEIPATNLEQFYDGLEGGPLGIITLEDVLEELIGEEIYDEYDKDGGPQSAASQFIPQEAVQAAKKAQLERERKQLATAASTPLPVSNDKDLEPQPIAPVPKRALAKLPKFSLGKPRSQPGRSRSETRTPLGAEKPKRPITPAATPRPVDPEKRAPSPVPTFKNEDEDNEAAAATGVPAMSMPSVAIDDTPVVIPGTTTPPPGVISSPPSSSNLLAEALTIERMRRLGGTATAPPSMSRTTSATGVPRAAIVRQPTPAGGVKRPTKFKSTPLPVTPAGSTTPAPPTPITSTFSAAAGTAEVGQTDITKTEEQK